MIHSCIFWNICNYAECILHCSFHPSMCIHDASQEMLFGIMKFHMREFYQELSRYFSFHLDHKIFQQQLYTSAYMCFCEYVQHNLLYDCWSKKLLQRKVLMESEPRTSCLVHSSICFTAFQIIKLLWHCAYIIIFLQQSWFPGHTPILYIHFFSFLISSVSLVQLILIILYSKGFILQKYVLEYLYIIICVC